MNVFKLLTDRFTSRGKALACYKRGMTSSNQRDHEGAIAEYTSAIEMENVPPDIRAMALYNRALVYAASNRNEQATSDLNTVLEMKEAVPNIKEEAKRKLARMQRNADKSEK